MDPHPDAGLAQPSTKGLRSARQRPVRLGFLDDSRAATLEEVFTKSHHKVGSDLPPDDLADLLRFLRSL